MMVMTTIMATARPAMALRDTTTTTKATKLTIMATTMTMATVVNDDDGDGVTGDGATGYNNNDDGNGR